MAEELSDAELDEIERRASAATSGPWESYIEGRDHFGGDNFIRIGGFDDSQPDMYIHHYLGTEAVPVPSEDLDFIASARQDIPRLVAEIRKLRSRPQG